MKKSSYDFSLPVRQHYAAIVMLIYKRIVLIARQLWPIVLVLLVGKSSELKINIAIGIAALTLISMILSIIGYFKYYFYTKDDELIVEKGVLSKKLINIPFERIQTINFEQNVIQRIFNVVGLKIDTAGSGKEEFSFEALDRPMAIALREQLLSQAHKLQDTSEIQEIEEPKSELVLSLSNNDLLKIGVVQNHLRSFGLILAFGVWIFQSLKDAGIDEDEMSAYIPAIDPNSITKVVLVLLIFGGIISFLISLITTVVKYYKLKLLRAKSGFKIISGLINRKEVAALDNKIQIISWSNNPLKRLLGIYDLNFKQASSIEMSTKKAIKVPGCFDSHLDQVKNSYFSFDQLSDMKHFVISRHYIYRKILYEAIVPSLIICALFYFFWSDKWIYAALLIPYIIYIVVTAFVRHKKRFYEFNQDIIFTAKGMYGNYYNLLKIYKIQGVKLIRSIYQQRKDLADVRIYTASGSIKIPYLKLDEARALRDFLIYKVEDSKENWM